MTILEAWAPGSPSDVLLHPLEPIGAPGGTMIAAGAGIGALDATIVQEQSGLLRVRLRADAAATLRLTARFTVVDAVSLWYPGSGDERATLPPSWVDPRSARPLRGVAMGCLLGRKDVALAAFGVDAGLQPVSVRAGMIEESGEFLLDIRIEEATAADVVLDLRGDSFSAAVRDVAAGIGLARPEGSPVDERPVLCTWYSFHQQLDVDGVLADARVASALGIGTLIIDDGWQTTEHERGYGSCGDWQVERQKIADPRSLVAQLEALGMRTLWWIGTPFIGHRSETFRDDGLAVAYDEPALDAAVLDPRSPRTRRVLVERLRSLLADSGAHGFKIDFLERFATVGDDAPADADVHSIEAGALRLLDEIVALGEREPLMIEFREPYITAGSLPRGTMFRVADCPLSPVQNRRGIVDMRLMTTGIAIHGDPIMWSETDSTERVAQQFVASLFGVPQLSVRLSELSQAHHDVIAHWLVFWNEHASTLLHAPLEVTGVDRDYATVETSTAAETITVRYGDGPIGAPQDARTWHVINGGEDGMLLTGLDGWGEVRVEVRDARGRITGGGEQTFGAVVALAVPAGGRAVLRPGEAFDA